ncbi:GNAT family N-acetyltransferase [Chloroflexota bacterium]
MDIRVVADWKEFESLAGIWDGLLQQAGEENSIYLTHEWLTTWWRHFGEGSKLNILLFEKQGRIIGIAPLMKTEYRAGFLKLRTLETIGAVNCNYVWVMPSENRREAIAALVSYLDKALASDGLVFRVTLVPEDSEFLALVRRHGPELSGNLASEEKVMTLAPYIPLPATWDDYFRTLSQKRRWVLRRSLGYLQEAHRVEFNECAEDALEDRLTTFIDLHQRRWQSANIRGIFSYPKTKEFYRDLAGRFFEKGWLHFSRLTVDGETASAVYSYVYNGKFYASTMARDIRYSRYSVGHLHYMFLIKDAIGRHLQEFDFLRGDEPYKFYWTKSVRRYLQITVIGRGRFPGISLKWIRIFLRACAMRRFGLRESYHLRRMMKREAQELRRMGLNTLK